jgi:pimeloyl-ACP methyl ester carboxylesterase
VAEPVDHAGTINGEPAFWRRGQDSRLDLPPILWVHGVPTSSDDWLPFLELAGGIAPDLPGFGRSTKRGDHPYDIDWYCDWLDSFLDHLGVDRVRLAVHDWGGLALAWAQRKPERVDRIVVINAVPLLPGYKWHRVARLWRTPMVGEVAMGLTIKPVLRLISREANVAPGPLPAELIDDAMSHFDQGTQRAILRLYRSSPPAKLAAAGLDLGELAGPSLVIWGEQDPYIPAEFADRYAEALGNAKAERVDGAGHWAWLDKPEIVERACSFLDGTD